MSGWVCWLFHKDFILLRQPHKRIALEEFKVRISLFCIFINTNTLNAAEAKCRDKPFSLVSPMPLCNPLANYNWSDMTLHISSCSGLACLVKSWGFLPKWQDKEKVQAKVIVYCSSGKDADGIRAANKAKPKYFLQLWESQKWWISKVQFASEVVNLIA